MSKSPASAESSGCFCAALLCPTDDSGVPGAALPCEELWSTKRIPQQVPSPAYAVRLRRETDPAMDGIFRGHVLGGHGRFVSDRL